MSRDERQAELLDGLIGALDTARDAVRAGSRAQADSAIADGYALLGELYGTLDHAEHPEVCANLQSVYDSCMMRIGRATQNDDPQSIDQALGVLRPIRAALA